MTAARSAVVAFALGLAGLVATSPATAQSVNDQLVRRYEKQRLEELIAAGQRHVDLGWAIRKTGLQQQATYEFVRAVEISEGKHKGATWVLNTVRIFGMPAAGRLQIEFDLEGDRRGRKARVRELD